MKGNKTGSKPAKNNREKRNLIMGIAMMVFAIAIAGGTYAYYQSTMTANITGTILAWDCTNTGTTNGTVNMGDLKPGTSGQFDFKIKSTNFRTDVVVSMKYHDTANVPANFGLYKAKSGSTYSNAIALARTGGTSAAATDVFTGTDIAANTLTTYTVYWDWPIGTTAEEPLSTTVDKTLQIDYTITCTQASTYGN